MAKLNFVKKARTDIYLVGKEVKYTSKKGKREGQELSKRDRTQSAGDKDTVLVKKGEPYYWWQFAYSAKQISKERPRASQLTQSEFLSTLFAIMERIEDMTVESYETVEDFQTELDDIKSELEQLRDDTQDKLDNMPDSLQQGSVGEMLQNRVDELESLTSDIDNIYCEEGDDDEETRSNIEAALEELQGLSYNGE